MIFGLCSRLGYYERLPIQNQAEAEAYYAHRSFREELWEKNGREGLSEYREREASGFLEMFCGSNFCFGALKM